MSTGQSRLKLWILELKIWNFRLHQWGRLMRRAWIDVKRVFWNIGLTKGTFKDPITGTSFTLKCMWMLRSRV
jgi:hypothetical protein